MSTYVEMFWSHVNKNGPIPRHCPHLGPCWIWTGKKRKGYGIFHKKDSLKEARAHHVSFELTFGPIPEGKIVLHKCDNPSCVNGTHLIAGTLKDNTRDMIEKGRHGKYKNISLEIAEQIRKMYATGEYSHRTLAKEFGLSVHTRVGKIVRHEIWASDDQKLYA